MKWLGKLLSKLINNPSLSYLSYASQNQGFTIGLFHLIG